METPRETAQRLGVSLPTVRRMLAQGEFGDAARRVRRRWKILEGAWPTRVLEQTQPRRLTKQDDTASQWERQHRAAMAEFTRQLIAKVRPRFIVIRHRKGERVFAALKLVPPEALPRVFELEYFELMPEDRRCEMLAESRVLLLDDTMQRGRRARLGREWLVGQAPRLEVFIGCLFLRRSCRENGTLEVPDVEAYQEVDDYSYGLATAELSRVHRSLWPLDLEHPTVWVRIPSSVSEDDMLATLGMMGQVIELPPLVWNADMRVWVVESITVPRLAALNLPRVLYDWEPKLRIIWLPRDRVLIMAGIWFPRLHASLRWLRSYHPQSADPLYVYLGLADAADWSLLDTSQRAHLLFRAAAIYAGTRLVAEGLGALADVESASFDVEPGRWDLQIEREDYERVYGPNAAQRMTQAIRSEIVHRIRLKVTAGLRRMHLNAPSVQCPANGLSIGEFTEPLVNAVEGVQGSLSWPELESAVKACLRSHDRENGEGRLPNFSSRVDVALDHGLIAPENRLRATENSVTVERAYECCEPGRKDSPAETEALLVEKRLRSGVPVAYQVFQKTLGASLSSGMHPLVFNKLLVNIQANLSMGAVNPKDVNQTRVLVYEQGELLGPMAYTPPAMTPHNVLSVEFFLSRMSEVVRRRGADGAYVDLAQDITEDGALAGFEAAWRDQGESVIADAQLLGELFRGIRRGPDYSGPATGNLLTALAACSREERFIHYAVEDIRIWHQNASSIVATLSLSQVPGSGPAVAQDALGQMLTAGSALSDKLEWYKGIADWRRAVEELQTSNDFAKLRLLRRIDHAPVWRHDDRPVAERVLLVEPMVRLTGVTLRYLATQVGAAGALAKAPASQGLCSTYEATSRDHQWCNLAEAVGALKCQSPSEIEAVAGPLKFLSGFADTRVTAELAESLARLWATVDSLLKPVLALSPSRTS